MIYVYYLSLSPVLVYDIHIDTIVDELLEQLLGSLLGLNKYQYWRLQAL